MEKQYQYGDKIINYKILRKVVKSITLKVTPTEEVIITAHPQVSEEYVEEVIRKRAAWIISKLSSYEEINTNKSKKTYANGFSHRYLGRNYRLKFIKNTDKTRVRYYQGYIEVHMQQEQPEEKLKEFLEKWYLERSKEKFVEVYERIYIKFQPYNIEKPKLNIRKMKARWGSYTPHSNTIILNSELIKTSLACLEYVIVHEMTHALHPDHSRKFYSTLSALLPDWEQRKKLLEKEGIDL